MNKNLIAKAPISINAPSDKVWNALVKPESIKQYMFGTNVSPTDGKEVRLFGKVTSRQTITPSRSSCQQAEIKLECLGPR